MLFRIMLAVRSSKLLPEPPSTHLRPGKSFSINHVHVHDVQPFASTDFNLTHTIRHLSFGAKLGAPSSTGDEDQGSVTNFRIVV